MVLAYPLTVSGLLYPQLKTARARFHLKGLDEHLRRFEADPYSISEHDDYKRGLHVIRIQLKRQEAVIAMLIGEYAYHLRSALDQLVWQLALLSGRNPGGKSAFPIQSSDSDIDRERFMYATWNVPCEAAAIIKTLQPYQRGKAHKTHPLWRLNKLCNLDKHATIGYSETGVRFTYIYFNGVPMIQPPFVIDETTGVVEILIPIADKENITIKPETPELIFGKPREVLGPVFQLTESDITEIHGFVRYEVLPNFARFFPNSPTIDSITS